MTSLQLAYVVASPFPLIARWRRSRWTRALLILWGVLFAAAVSLAPSAWGEAPLSSDVVAGLATAAIALVVGCLLCRGLTPGTPAGAR
jgi:hypothetical protein